MIWLILALTVTVGAWVWVILWACGEEGES